VWWNGRRGKGLLDLDLGDGLNWMDPMDSLADLFRIALQAPPAPTALFSTPTAATLALSLTLGLRETTLLGALTLLRFRLDQGRMKIRLSDRLCGPFFCRSLFLEEEIGDAGGRWYV
jgi:hypothetical protein